MSWVTTFAVLIIVAIARRSDIRFLLNWQNRQLGKPERLEALA
ncbi:hypothetical protein [Laspinema sp. D2d]|nr:hypothetical protein [Laspinema sp. D2d]